MKNTSESLPDDHKRHKTMHDISKWEPSSDHDYAYDHLHEWPSDNALGGSGDPCSPPAYRKFGLRLVVSSSRTLSKSRVAIIDGYSEIQLGRDNPVSDQLPRIRLKEMEVSKIHASIYWDRVWDGWAVVDMGSKHGTYLCSNNSTQEIKQNLRLSISRTASTPKRLRHLDHLTLGTTVFVVHIHENQLSCAECSSRLGEEIPLFSNGRKSSSNSHYTNIEQSSGYEASKPPLRDPKAALSQLKHQLMSKSRHSTDVVNAGHYVDRSARRRAMYSALSSDAPGVSAFSRSAFAEFPKTTPQLRSEPISEPAAPIPSSSIGHKLLIKQGWHPGTALGAGIAEPLDIKFNCDRSGLGSRALKRSNGSVLTVSIEKRHT